MIGKGLLSAHVCAVAVIVFLLALPVTALELGSPFSDGLVLQRDRAVKIWGFADPGETASVEFAGTDGRWLRATIVNIVPRADWMNEGILTDRNRIVLTAPGLSAPRKVRYWYAPPYYGAIYNEVNLPLGPFAAEVTEAEKRVRVN